MPSNKKKSKNKAVKNTGRPTASAGTTSVKIGELDPRKACKLLPESRRTPFVQDYCKAVDYYQQAQEVAARTDGHVLARVRVIQACILLTDLRILLDPTIFQIVPRCTILGEITVDSREHGRPWLPNMSVETFISLLFDSIMLHISGAASIERRVIHELQEQLNANVIDFKGLETNPDFYGGITKKDIAFAVAIMGVKINRLLYRLPDAQREQSPHLFEIPSTAQLLNDCTYFAKLQNEIRPESPTSSMNLAWVATEKQEYLEMHNWYEKSIVRADATGDDVVRLTSRMELAGSMILGSGINPPPNRVKRSEIQSLCDVFDKGCKELAQWSMDTFAKGEVSMDEFVKDCLKNYPRRNEYIPTWERGSFIPRDLGQAPEFAVCDGCKQQVFDFMKCGACKKTAYCSKACQKSHWRAGHKEVCKGA